jgi:prepilin-type N-terminal cleavage/methylation domain-containing protein/prepilin-type processing-associated H-X9-DG protein
MRLLTRKSGAVAFTLIELICVIAIIGILAALVLPAVSRSRGPAQRSKCVNQLRQAGIAFHSFAHDHNNRFPMAVPRAEGGSLEFAKNAYRVNGDFYFGFRHFQAVSNQLVAPRLLICPSDQRLPAQSFSELKNENVSYFVSLSSTMDTPLSVLAGDRNVTVVSAAVGSTLLRVSPGQFLRWTSGLHEYKGNLLFADGHVEQRHDFELKPGQGGAAAPADFVLPSVQQQAPAGSGGGGGDAGGTRPEDPPQPWTPVTPPFSQPTAPPVDEQQPKDTNGVAFAASHRSSKKETLLPTAVPPGAVVPNQFTENLSNPPAATPKRAPGQVVVITEEQPVRGAVESSASSATFSWQGGGWWLLLFLLVMLLLVLFVLQRYIAGRNARWNPRLNRDKD